MRAIHDAEAARREKVVAAILLVADGHYREVVVTNLPDAVAVALELTPAATRAGVRLDVLGTCAADCHAVKVRQR